MYAFNLGRRFLEITEKHGSKVAIECNDTSVSYFELEKLSSRAGHSLLAKGVGCGDVVCVTSKKDIDVYAVMIGCWNVGAICCFVDRLSPIERLKKVLNTCAPSLIITDFELSERVNKISGYKVASANEMIGNDGLASFDYDSVPSSSIAYIMFTSGSTGDPKGVAISHASVINFSNWAIREFKVTSTDKLSNINPLYFDNSVFDLYVSILSGATLIPISRAMLRSPYQTVDAFANHGVTIIFGVPSFFVYLLTVKAIQKEKLPSVRNIIFGGEGFPKNKLQELYEMFCDSARLSNVYGPTECTCICSNYDITATDFTEENTKKLAPLGRISDNISYDIVDEEMNSVAKGNVGELLLGGGNVALGYYNSREKTEEKFVQNPRHEKYRDIMYKTGDLVKENHDSRLLCFIGRNDDQIKVMGHRIELGEIESVVSSFMDVDECAVVHRISKGYPDIGCFWSGTVTAEKLRSRLSRFLPSYMMPHKYISVQSLPKNPNGKIDRKSLKELKEW